jgi:hypothetical protein
MTKAALVPMQPSFFIDPLFWTKGALHKLAETILIAITKHGYKLTQLAHQNTSAILIIVVIG